MILASGVHTSMRNAKLQSEIGVREDSQLGAGGLEHAHLD
jgi:hypothetical protein